MSDTSKLKVSLEPMWENKNGEDRACANLTIQYDNVVINLEDTVYTYYFDDKPVKSFLDVVNPSTGVHKFTVVVSYKGETKIVSKCLAYSKYGKVKIKTITDKPKYTKNATNFVVRRRFPFYTAQIGQVYVTKTIQIHNREDLLSINNLNFNMDVISYNFKDGTRDFINMHVNEGFTSVTLSALHGFVRHKDGIVSMYSIYNLPNSNFRKIPLPDRIDGSYPFNVEFKLYVSRYIPKRDRDKVVNFWKKMKVYSGLSNIMTCNGTTININHLSKYYFKFVHYTNQYTNVEFKSVKFVLKCKSIVQLRIRTHNNTFSDWGYYRFYDGVFTKLNKKT